MIETSVAREAPAEAPWTCPFCALLCDGYGITADAATGALRLVGSDCPRAEAALRAFGTEPAAAHAAVDGAAATLAEAVAAAATLLSKARQPLFGGLATDVAGARALYRLACATGAVCDAAGGDALMQGVRVLQDRGGYTTTLAEVRTRADLVVCVGGMPTARYPEFHRRCTEGRAEAPAWVVIGDDDEGLPAGAERLPLLNGDTAATLAMLAALVAGRSVPDAGLSELAARLKAARYAVLVYETARFGPQGAVQIEALQRIVATLNRSTRAAALPLGGGDGASTVNAVHTWLSGLPLRTRSSALGLEHEPALHGADRLLRDGSVDALLWIASFGSKPEPPEMPDGSMPRIVLGHPSLAGSAATKGCVFIAVSTPGIGSAGHLLRTDGSVLLPLRPARADALPTVADVLGRLLQALPAKGTA